MATSDEEARQLIRAANKDLRALQGMIDASIFADEIFGFHAQQAVEKALKAWLSLLGEEYPKTHDLSLLLNLLNAHDQLDDSFYQLVEFNPYAIQYRYEAFDEIGEPLNRDVVIDRVGKLIEKIQALIV
jgi:HEPN domain-containing protein